MIIPHTSLNDELLTAILEEYITRGGLDDTTGDASEVLVKLKKRLEKNEIFVVFDAEEETTSLMSKSECLRSGLL